MCALPSLKVIKNKIARIIQNYQELSYKLNK